MGTGALKGGILSHFLTSIVAKHQKFEEGPFGENCFFEKKVSQCQKNWKGTSFSPGMVCYAEKEENLFGSVRKAKLFNLGP